MVTGLRYAAVLLCALAAPVQAVDGLDALAERARARAAAVDPSGLPADQSPAPAPAAASHAPELHELAEAVRNAQQNARSLIGEELHDGLESQLASGRAQYDAEMREIQAQSLKHFKAGIELAKDLAGSQYRALQASGALGQPEDEQWKNPRFRLFITQAMPDAEIKELIELARHDESLVLVFRGLLPGQKLPALHNRIARLIGQPREGERVPSITMDPKPFNELGVDQAPVLAEYDKDGRLLGYALGMTSREWMAEQTGAGRRGHLGIYGPTVEVAEEDIIEVVKKRAAEFDWAKSAEGALDRFWARTEAHEIPHTQTERVRMLDPTFEVTQSIIAPDGTVIAQAGDRVNPLDAVPVKSTLVFFDPASADQVRWAKQQVDANRGRPVTLMASQLRTLDGLEGLSRLGAQLGARVFSLPDAVRKTFHIERVPTVVTVRDRQYHIHEQVP